MPSVNRVKEYVKGAYYHAYNRGVNRCPIFLEESDFAYFIEKIEYFLTRGLVDISAYCFMDNHYHFVLHNKVERGIEKFMHSLFTSYSLYINRKYGRVGHLFQERYKARMLKSEWDIFDVLEYIHANPEKDGPYKRETYAYSSCRYYLKGEGPSWLTLLRP